MGDLVKRMKEEWVAGLQAQKAILDGIRPNDERVSYRREQLMMEGYDQIQAESLARQEVAETEMEALGISFDAARIKAEFTAAEKLPRGAHTHTDLAQNTTGCDACGIRENRARHRAHINAAQQIDNTCPICIDSEAKLNEHEVSRMQELLEKRDAGAHLSKKEKKKLNKLVQLAAASSATAPPAEEPKGPVVRKGFSPASWWPFQMERLHANLEVVASVNDVAFITTAINDLRAFIDTRLGDLHELNGLGRDGKERTPEAPRCENGPKCKLQRFHWGTCELWLNYKEDSPARTAPVAVPLRGDHAADCPCQGCEWADRKAAKDAKAGYCTVHSACDQEQKDCKLTWLTGTSVGQWPATMCNNGDCTLPRGHRLGEKPTYACSVLGAPVYLLPAKASAVVEGKQLTLVQSGDGQDVRIHTGFDNNKPAFVINVIGQSSADDPRVYRYKCLQSPDGTDTSQLQHLWYATLDAKFKQNLCPECGARPKLAEAKPLSGSQFKAWKLGQEKLNAPQT